ncbi:hypothetical protein [Neobacillus bataviensis]|nr:hypothetical protein [Neobacillus bataviensis]
MRVNELSNLRIKDIDFTSKATKLASLYSLSISFLS